MEIKEVKDKLKKCCEKVTPEQKKLITTGAIAGLVGFTLGMLVRRK